MDVEYEEIRTPLLEERDSSGNHHRQGELTASKWSNRVLICPLYLLIITYEPGIILILGSGRIEGRGITYPIPRVGATGVAKQQIGSERRCYWAKSWINRRPFVTYMHSGQGKGTYIDEKMWACSETIMKH